VYRVKQPAFFSLAYLALSGFAIFYWLPFRFRQTLSILLSLVGAYILPSPMVASFLMALA
jgi:hypothetical protein